MVSGLAGHCPMRLASSLIGARARRASFSSADLTKPYLANRASTMDTEQEIPSNILPLSNRMVCTEIAALRLQKPKAVRNSMTRVLGGLFRFREGDDVGWNGAAGLFEGLKKLLLCDRFQYRNATFQHTEFPEKTPVSSAGERPSENNQEARTGDQ